MLRFHRHGTRPLALICLLVMPLLIPSQARAGEVMVAVASNFAVPMKELAARFSQNSGHRAILSFGSSGKFTAQIQHGAPFDVFLSADQAKPEALVRAGMAEADSRFTYALGTLALWSAKEGADVLKQLQGGQFNRLALANPRLAPYGEAAVQTLAALGLQNTVAHRQVMGENISQTWQFVSSGNADLGFVALSQIMAAGQISSGSVWVVPSALHQPIRQDAVLLKKGRHNAAAEALLSFLQSDDATHVIRRYGYHRE